MSSIDEEGNEGQIVTTPEVTSARKRETNGKAEAIVANMPQRPAIRHGMRKAFYAVKADTISMPDEKHFDSTADYYASLFHELIHATGHENRLHRASLSESRGYGTDPYCKEELIAEIGAAFLCAHVGIIDRTINNSAAYLQGWLTSLREDKTLIVKAAAQAEKAVNFILGITSKTPTCEVPTSTVPVAISEPLQVLAANAA